MDKVSKTTKPNWANWLKSDAWDWDQCLHLWLDTEPVDDKYHNLLGNDFLAEFQKRHGWMKGAFDTRKLKPVSSRTGRYTPGTYKSYYFSPPQFARWAETKAPVPSEFQPLLEKHDETAKSEPNPRKSTITKQAVQAVAKTLWDFDPEATITALVSHHAIQEHAGAKHYGNKTVHGWLSEVDPRLPKKKTGRPKGS